MGAGPGGARGGARPGRPADPPLSAASAFGDPHFVTFDGANFTFNGRGEYVLLEAALTRLSVQARAEPRTTPQGEARPRGLGGSGSPAGKLRLSGPRSAPAPPGVQQRGTGLTAVAVQEDSSDVVEVRLAGGAGPLQVLLNQEVLSFAEQNWMDLKGEWAAGPRLSRCCLSRAQMWRWSHRQPSPLHPPWERPHSGPAMAAVGRRGSGTLE